MSTAGNEIDFIVPKEGCDSPMIETATFPGGGIFTLNVPKKFSPLANAGKQDVPLISASNSIDVSKVVFGETVNSAGYFFFTDANGSSTNALGQVYRTADDIGGATIKGVVKRGFVVAVAAGMLILGASAAAERVQLNPVIPFLAITGRPTTADLAAKIAALQADGFEQFMVYARSGLQYRY